MQKCSIEINKRKNNRPTKENKSKKKLAFMKRKEKRLKNIENELPQEKKNQRKGHKIRRRALKR
jgi:hypothetical protein